MDDPSRESQWASLGLPVVIIAAAVAILLLPHLEGLPSGVYSDVSIAHLPQIFYLRRALSRWHTIPLWSPVYYSGYPFYADPLAEIWYPPAWLMVFLPLPLGLWLTLGLHLLGSGLGMFALLRRWGRGHLAALLGALAWTLLPKTWAHWSAGHLSLLFAVAWTPWLVFALERRERWLSPALVWAVIFLADPRWAAYAAVLWVFVVATRVLRKEGGGTLTFRKKPGLRSLPDSSALSWRSLFRLLPLLVAAPLGLPLLHYSRLSTRAALLPQEVLRFSLAPWRLFGLLVPTTSWFHEWVIYVGVVPVLLAVAAWWHGRSRLWLWLAAGAVLWSMGAYLPGMTAIARLPLVDMLRVPPRAMFLCGFAFVIAAADGLDLLGTMGGGALAKGERFALFAVAIIGGFLGFGLLATAGMWREAVLLVLLWGGAWGLIIADFPARWRALALIGVLLADFLVVDSRFVRHVPFEEAFAVPPAVEKAVARTSAPLRIYSPSYSVPQQAAAARGWELANGVDPLVLASYAAFIERASGVPYEGYSVVTPPLQNGYRLANAAYSPDPGLLGLLNVEIVVAHFPIHSQELAFVGRDAEVWVYRNRSALPRLWVETDSGDALSRRWTVRPAHLICWCPNRLRASASGPGILVFSEVAYPGWQAFVDGRRVPLQTAYDILRAVPLAAGEHEVELRFRPFDLTVGLLLGAMGLLAWLVEAIFPQRERRRQSLSPGSALPTERR